jgi:hypothetical protein
LWVLLVVVAVGIAIVYASPLRPDCTVGFVGTDVNVEFEGWGAGAGCDDFVRHTSIGQSSGDQLPLGSGYERSPGGTVMCRYKVNGLTYTVRDSGVLKMYGAALCDRFQQEVGKSGAT